MTADSRPTAPQSTPRAPAAPANTSPGSGPRGTAGSVPPSPGPAHQPLDTLHHQHWQSVAAFTCSFTFLNVARILSQLYDFIRVRPRSEAPAPPVLLRPVQCNLCAAPFSVPNISAEQRSEIATLVRANRGTRAAANLYYMVWQRRSSRWPLIFQIFVPEEAPPPIHNTIEVIRHITTPAGVCSNCKTQLTSRGQSECPNCHALTLDW